VNDRELEQLLHAAGQELLLADGLARANSVAIQLLEALEDVLGQLKGYVPEWRGTGEDPSYKQAHAVIAHAYKELYGIEKEG